MVERGSLHVHSAVPEFIEPVFAKTSPKKIFFNDWKRAFWACFRENWVYKFGQLVVERDTYCLGWKEIHPARTYCWWWKELHPARTYYILLAVERDTPCMERDTWYICMSIPLVFVKGIPNARLNCRQCQPITGQHDTDTVSLALKILCPQCSIHKGSNEKPFRVKSFTVHNILHWTINIGNYYSFEFFCRNSTKCSIGCSALKLKI